MKLSIVIPCFNEVDNIHKLEMELIPILDGLAGFRLPDGTVITDIETVFVDDGSKDDTLPGLESAFGKLARRNITFQFKRHEFNRGLGAALRTAFDAVTGEIILTTDSDGTYRYATIPEMLRYLESDISIVTASPYHPDGEVVGVPAYRIFLSRGSSLLYRLLLNWKIHTYTALFRVYRREVIDRIGFVADDYLGATELMVKAMLSGFKVAEYPAALHRRVFGVSKAKLIRTIISHLRFQFALLLHRLAIKSLFETYRSQPRAFQQN